MQKNKQWDVWIVCYETPYGWRPADEKHYRYKEAALESITNPQFIGKPIRFTAINEEIIIKKD